MARFSLATTNSSTIAGRLALVLLVPLAGLVFFGGLAARHERTEAARARELRVESELVALLSETAVSLDLEAQILGGFEQARRMDVDLSQFASVAANGDAAARRDAEVQSLFERVRSTDPQLWADPAAVRDFLDARAVYDALLAESSPGRFDSRDLRVTMADAVARALAAQNRELAVIQGLVDLSAGQNAMAQSLARSASLMQAAQDERTALAEYLLPFNERSDNANYRRLVAAAAYYDSSLAALRAGLSADQWARLDEIQAMTAWTDYDQLRTRALDGEIAPFDDVSDPWELLPVGLVLFVDGFERSTDLLGFDSSLGQDFTEQALELEAAANDRLLRATVFGALLAILTVAASAITIRSITLPVRALLDRAERISAGDLETEGPALGPADIGLVHRALDDMSANLRTLTSQAEALSEGRLDDEVLHRSVGGPLEASIHGSLARLRSMTARLEYEATHDALTLLPNRAALLSLLDRCLTGDEARRTELTIIMLDLDGFKLANDQMGHGVGDEVLKHVANRLRTAADGDFIARLGGDEFMIVVVGPDRADRAARVAADAIASIGEPITVSPGTANLSASAGIVGTAGPSWLSPTEVLRRVDLAMYEAKAEGPGSIVHFDQRLHDSLLETTQLQGELRLALDRDEFHLHLQPIVSIDDGRPVGFEALIRWNSPVRGAVSPGLFIPIAEQSELIAHIDSWVIERTGELLGAWSVDPVMRDYTLSVNISGRHLSHPGLVPKIAEVIALHGFPADRYVIEVTESQLIPNLARAEDTLLGLRSLGVRLAIDDFGTGYASVAHLRRVQFDRLKIDQSFLAHLDDDTDRSLANLLASLGRNLDLEVVAEGVEADHQLRWAAGAGCTHGQGYFLGRPGPPDHWEEHIRVLEAERAKSR